MPLSFRVSLAQKAALITGSLLFLALLLEGVCRLSVWIAPPPPDSHYAFRKQQPAPYKDAPYFSKEFLDESFKQPGGWTISREFGYVPDNFNGRFFNVRNHRRVTIGQPANAKRRLLIFGGSTVYCSETPDELTLPSQLQRILAADTNSEPIAVENYGATSVTLRHQLARLVSETLRPGDIVVFYDGVNDVIQSLFYKDPDGTMADQNRRQIERLSPAARLLFRVHLKLAPYSQFVALLLKPKFPAREGPSMDLTEQELERFEADTVRLLRAAELHCRSNQAEFFHFVQPTLFTSHPRTDYEGSLLSAPWLTPPGLEGCFERGLPRFAKAHLRSGVAGADLSGALQERSSEIFLDFCHVNHEGNALLARRMAAVLREQGSPGL